MVEIYFDKLYKNERVMEDAFVAIPFAKGKLFETGKLGIIQDGNSMPCQFKVTSNWDDGSIRYLLARFQANIPGNKKTVCRLEETERAEFEPISVKMQDDGIIVSNGKMKFAVANNSGKIFEWVQDGTRIYDGNEFVGPELKSNGNNEYNMHIDRWEIEEDGPVCIIIKGYGSNVSCNGDENVDFEIRLTSYASKPWIEMGYRLINTTHDVLHISSLVMGINAGIREIIHPESAAKRVDGIVTNDSTGCKDSSFGKIECINNIYHTVGTADLKSIEQVTPVNNIRTVAGSSNYKTEFFIGKDGEYVSRVVQDADLVKEANEHFAEVLYGTFFADRTDENGGICATIFQAQQNYPKAISADKDGIRIFLVPEGLGDIVMQSGMSREQKFMLYMHDADTSIEEIDNRSLIYQMPDRPWISPDVYKEANVFIDVFADKFNEEFEIAMMGKADAHARCYGMMNFGDSWDPGYTNQGRGGGRLVWVNNEYDFPHACAMQYARTGVRRFLDYTLIAAEHWMDVDVCHFSDDPLRKGGQWEHTAGHCNNGTMVCSHEWVEGLLDYYHFTGNKRAYDTAIGIGENVLRLLDTPMLAKPGEANARETGWALRTLTALYVETHDEKWTKKCRWIVESFEQWEKQYGYWLAPYTDNTTVRVGFMISVAVGSVMRYYREFPDDDIKKMILREVDDLIENCYMNNGLFYYKELPSLSRLGNNTLLLESLAIAYELTGDSSYLKYGMRTYEKYVTEAVGKTNGVKKIVEDAVVCSGSSTKTFGQSFIPVATFYKAASDNGLIAED